MRTNMEIIRDITNELCNIMENGTNPWIKPWKSLYNGKPNPNMFAYNYNTKKPYKGINQLILPNGYYATFKQIKDLGGSVNKGSHSHTVVFFEFKEYEVEEETKTSVERDGRYFEIRPILRTYNVFNLKDTNLNVDYSVPTDDEVGGVSQIDEIEECINSYVERSGLKLFEEFGDRAYYSPLLHEVHVPKACQFDEVGEYYSTKFHELGHSTAKFFGRECVDHFDGFGGQVYSREELIAEMCSAYCLGYFGIDTTSTKMNSSAYLKSWAKHIRNDQTLGNKIINATTESVKAFEMICNVKMN